VHSRLEHSPRITERGIGTGRENVRAPYTSRGDSRASHSISWRFATRRKALAVRPASAEHLQALDSPHLEQGFDVRAGHAARAEQPSARQSSAHDAGPDGAVRGDAQVLQGASLMMGERSPFRRRSGTPGRSAAGREQYFSRVRAPSYSRSVHDVGFHPDGEIAAVEPPSCCPLVELRGIARRDADVDAGRQTASAEARSR